jgi:hypothetical protein
VAVPQPVAVPTPVRQPVPVAVEPIVAAPVVYGARAGVVGVGGLYGGVIGGANYGLGLNTLNSGLAYGSTLGVTGLDYGVNSGLLSGSTITGLSGSRVIGASGAGRALEIEGFGPNGNFGTLSAGQGYYQF